MLRVTRIINNNVIVTEQDHQEVILTGRGLGFGLKPGSTYDPARVERRFVLENDRTAAGFQAVIEELPYELLVLSNQISDHVRATLGLTLSNAVQLALADHINFTLQRLAEGQALAHPLLWELKSTYRTEFTAALEILELIRAQTGVAMPVDEAGFLTMHLVNAGMNRDMAATVAVTTAVNDIVAIVRERLGVALEPDSVAYARFLTHLKFAVQRLQDRQLLHGSDNDLYNMVRVRDPLAHSCAVAIADYVLREHGTELPNEELLYLMVHINRLRARDAPAS